MPEVIHIVNSEGLYGAERAILNLMRAVKQYSFRVVCFEKKSGSHQPFLDELRKLGIEAETIPSPYSGFFRNVRNFSKWVKSGDRLRLHCHGYKETMMASLVQRKHPSTRIVCTQHGFTNKSFKTRTFSRIETALMKKRSISQIICASNLIRDHYEAVGVPAEKLHFVVNSVEVPDKASIPPLSERDIDFLYLGRLSPEKGGDLLIDALGELLSDGVNCNTVFAGDGRLREELETQAAELGLGSSAKFVGYCDEPEALIRRAKWLVLPSRTEGLPMSALEAMSLGTPLIATRVGELPKLLDDRSGGYLLAPESIDELKHALLSGIRSDSDSWQRLSLGAHETVKHGYSLETYGRNIADIYDKAFL